MIKPIRYFRFGCFIVEGCVVIMKINRLVGILSILLQKDKVTANEFAEKFEVSRRTIIRDIEDINMAGIPIVTTKGCNGGISIMDSFKIDKTVLSFDEMKSILAGLQSLDSVCDNNNYKQLMDKLSADDKNMVTADNSIIIDLSSWDKSIVSNKIELIKAAIENNEKISFTYFAPNGDSERIIEPYHIIFQWSSWYVWGFCIKRQDYRMFKLTRLTDLKLTGEKCGNRDVPEYVSNKLLHAEGGEQITVKFDKSVKWRIIDEYGMEIPQFDRDGNSILTFRWSDIPAFYQYILSFGDKAEITSPENYRREFANLLINIKEKYEI